MALLEFLQKKTMKGCGVGMGTDKKAISRELVGLWHNTTH